MEEHATTAAGFDILLSTANYRGQMYDRFHARKSPSDGPGWFIFGRNPSYNDYYVMLCARPNRPLRKVPLYNGQARCGFRTMRDAVAVAAELNRRAKDCEALMYSVTSR